MLDRRIKDIFNQEDVNFLKVLGYQDKAYINAPNPETGSHILHDAIVAGREQIVKELLGHTQKFINEPDEDEDRLRHLRTPLALAICEDNPIMVKLLVDAKADVEKTAVQDTRNPLMLAASSTEKIEILQTLLEAKAYINKEHEEKYISYSKQMTALMHAARSSNLPAIEFLIQHGANIRNSKNEEVYSYCSYDFEKEEIREYVALYQENSEKTLLKKSATPDRIHATEGSFFNKPGQGKNVSAWNSSKKPWWNMYRSTTFRTFASRQSSPKRT